MSQKSHPLTDRNFALVSSIAVVVAGIVGFWLLGTPGQQRLKSLDQERVRNLQTIARQIENSDLPDEDKLEDQLPERFNRFTDPVTDEPYEYRKVNETTYELCATFATQSTESDRYYAIEQEWAHPAGRHCYEMTIYASIPESQGDLNESGD